MKQGLSLDPRAHSELSLGLLISASLVLGLQVCQNMSLVFFMDAVDPTLVLAPARPALYLLSQLPSFLGGVFERSLSIGLRGEVWISVNEFSKSLPSLPPSSGIAEWWF